MTDMLLAADENLDNDIIRGLRRKLPDLDIIRIQDTEVYQKDDPAVLEWCANENRILLTHDINTMPGYAYERVKAGHSMHGVFVLPHQLPIGQVIEELQITITASDTSEWENQVVFFPI